MGVIVFFAKCDYRFLLEMVIAMAIRMNDDRDNPGYCDNNYFIYIGAEREKEEERRRGKMEGTDGVRETDERLRRDRGRDIGEEMEGKEQREDTKGQR